MTNSDSKIALYLIAKKWNKSSHSKTYNFLRQGVNFAKILQVSFFVGKFCAKVFCTYILGLNLFLVQECWHKCAIKMSVKMAMSVNFTNILWEFSVVFFPFTFALFWRRENYGKYGLKMLVKLTMNGGLSKCQSFDLSTSLSFFEL